MPTPTAIHHTPWHDSPRSPGARGAAQAGAGARSERGPPRGARQSRRSPRHDRAFAKPVAPEVQPGPEAPRKLVLGGGVCADPAPGLAPRHVPSWSDDTFLGNPVPMVRDTLADRTAVVV